MPNAACVALRAAPRATRGASSVRAGLWLAPLLSALVALGGGCRSSKRSSGPEAPPRERIFAYADGGQETIDPTLAAESAGTRIVQQLFEGLVEVPLGEGPPVPAAAERWEISADGRTFTFHLRPSARWSDGVPVTSADFLFSHERALNPKTGSRNAMHLWIIQGARDYNTGKEHDFSQVGVEAIDPLTLRYRLTGPAPYFLDLLRYVVYMPIPKHVVERHGSEWTRPGTMVSNGAFHLTEWKRRDYLHAVKNPHYWGAADVWLDGFRVYASESELSALRWYELGKVMWTPGMVPTDKMPELLRSGRRDLHIDSILCTYYYAFNTRKPPFDDVRVRRAFNMALDKGRLTRHLLGQGQQPASHLVPPLFSGTRGYGEVPGDPFNPRKARELIQAAGYGPGGRPFPEVVLLYNTFEAHRRVAVFMQRSLLTHLGVEVQIANMEWKTLLPTIQGGEFQIARSGWCADFPDPQDFLQVFHSRGENNYPRFSDPEYDRIIEQLSVTADQAVRNRLSAQAEAILNREVPFLPIYFYTRAYMLKPYVTGFEHQVQDLHPFRYIRFRGPEARK